MTNNVVLIQNENGITKPYAKASGRLKDFLEDFPLPQYRLRITSKPFLDNNAAAVVLEMVKAQISPALHFPAIQMNSVLITATLRDSNNEIILEASALQQITNYKDYEAGETAALNRLLVAAGRHGEIMDYDEESNAAKASNTNQDYPAQESATEEDASSSEPTEQKAQTSIPSGLIRNLKNHIKKAQDAGIDVPDDVPSSKKEVTARIQEIQAKLREATATETDDA